MRFKHFVNEFAEELNSVDLQKLNSAINKNDEEEIKEITIRIIDSIIDSLKDLKPGKESQSVKSTLSMLRSTIKSSPFKGVVELLIPNISSLEKAKNYIYK